MCIKLAKSGWRPALAGRGPLRACARLAGYGRCAPLKAVWAHWGELHTTTSMPSTGGIHQRDSYSDPQEAKRRYQLQCYLWWGSWRHVVSLAGSVGRCDGCPDRVPRSIKKQHTGCIHGWVLRTEWGGKRKKEKMMDKAINAHFTWHKRQKILKHNSLTACEVRTGIKGDTFWGIYHNRGALRRQ